MEEEYLKQTLQETEDVLKQSFFDGTFIKLERKGSGDN